VDFEQTARGREYADRVADFIRTEIAPVERRYFAELRARADRWVVLPAVRELKAKARAQGLWNLYLPDPRHGPGLTNLEYAPLAELMGGSQLAPEVFNCNAPDSGNAEVLLHHGSDEQRSRWLEPLLRGEIRCTPPGCWTPAGPHSTRCHRSRRRCPRWPRASSTWRSSCTARPG
jgi:acyl-CoA dehydrogenase